MLLNSEEQNFLSFFMVKKWNLFHMKVSDFHCFCCVMLSRFFFFFMTATDIIEAQEQSSFSFLLIFKV